jgi:hypothetical protein
VYSLTHLWVEELRNYKENAQPRVSKKRRKRERDLETRKERNTRIISPEEVLEENTEEDE